jgi:hypothetical protein
MVDQVLDQHDALDRYYGAGALGPRVTVDMMRGAIAETHFMNGADAFGMPKGHHPLALLTLCVLVLKSGFLVIGKSACVSPENYDVEKGRKAAYDNAFGKLWQLFGFQLRTDLYRNALQQIEGVASRGSTGPAEPA